MTKRLYWALRSGQLYRGLHNRVALRLDWLRARLAPSLVQVLGSRDLGERAYGHVRAVVEMGPRFPKSPGWHRQLDYIRTTLEGLGLQPERDRWHDPHERLDFENVWVTLPGEHPGRIVIGAHHDTKRFEGHADPAHNFYFVGANDGGSGVGLLLELARELKHRRNRATIQLVFFDGEESITIDWNDAKRALFGSRRYVGRALEAIRAGAEGDIHAMVLLDMVGCKTLAIDDDFLSDARLKHVFRRAVLTLGYARHFFGERRLVSDDHVPFHEAGIPTIGLVQHGNNPYWHTPDDVLDHVSARSLQMVGDVVLTALPAIESRFVP